MRKSTTGLLVVASCWLLAGATCQERPDPPAAVEVKVAIPVPCRVAEPQCAAPAYDAATKGQDGDLRIRLLRAETAEQADCLRRYRDALASCRQEVPPP